MYKISILIPAYNPDLNLFERCLKSIFDQDSADECEVIVGLQGDSDLTILQNKYPFKLIKLDRPSLSLTRVRLYNEASGLYVLFCDCDDYYLPHSLDDLACELLANDNPDILIFGYVHKIDNKKIGDFRPNIGQNKSKLNRDYAINQLFKGNIPNAIWTKCIKRKDNIKLPSIDVFMSEDLIFSYAFFLSSKDVCLSTNTFYVYDQSSYSGSLNGSVKFFYNYLDVFNYISQTGHNYEAYGDLTLRFGVDLSVLLCSLSFKKITYSDFRNICSCKKLFSLELELFKSGIYKNIKKKLPSRLDKFGYWSLLSAVKRRPLLAFLLIKIYSVLHRFSVFCKSIFLKKH